MRSKEEEELVQQEEKLWSDLHQVITGKDQTQCKKEKAASSALRFSSELSHLLIQRLKNLLNLWMPQYSFCKCEQHANLFHSAIPIGQHLWEHRKQGKPMEMKIVLFRRVQKQTSENTGIAYLIWDLKMKEAIYWYKRQEKCCRLKEPVGLEGSGPRGTNCTGRLPEGTLWMHIFLCTHDFNIRHWPDRGAE